MRRTWPWIGCMLVILALAGGRAVRGLPPDEPPRLEVGSLRSGPTAWEEGGAGGPAPLEAGVRHGRIFPPPEATAPRPDPALRPKVSKPRPPASPPAQPDPSAPAAGTAGGEADTRPAPQEAGQESISPAQVPPDTSAAATAPQGRSPILRPPVLLTPSAVYPGDAGQVTIDRSRLTPEIRHVAAQGRVVLRVLVRADGAVGGVEVAASSGHPLLDAAAAKASAGWRFQPATRDGDPIEAWALVPVRFVVP